MELSLEELEELPLAMLLDLLQVFVTSITFDQPINHFAYIVSMIYT